MARTMIFENGRVTIRGGDMAVIEPIGKTVSAEELQELCERHGFEQNENIDETAVGRIQ